MDEVGGEAGQSIMAYIQVTTRKRREREKKETILATIVFVREERPTTLDQLFHSVQ